MKENEREEKNGIGPAYYQEMPEYVPMDAVQADDTQTKTQEGLAFFCPACGEKISPGTAVCPKCGAALAPLWAEKNESLQEGTEDFRGIGKDAADAAGGETGQDLGSEFGGPESSGDSVNA